MTTTISTPVKQKRERVHPEGFHARLDALNMLADFCEQAKSGEQVPNHSEKVRNDVMEALFEARQAPAYREALENFARVEYEETSEEHPRLMWMMFIATDGVGRPRGFLAFENKSVAAGVAA